MRRLKAQISEEFLIATVAVLLVGAMFSVGIARDVFENGDIHSIKSGTVGVHFSSALNDEDENWDIENSIENYINNLKINPTSSESTLNIQNNASDPAIHYWLEGHGVNDILKYQVGDLEPEDLNIQDGIFLHENATYILVRRSGKATGKDESEIIINGLPIPENANVLFINATDYHDLIEFTITHTTENNGKGQFYLTINDFGSSKVTFASGNNGK
uniref:Uncharacterized protein n=1 Tax=Methanococcus maripaludis (strain C6 / ATCC BAA-1332) TaxID=444158 RepID=A9A731_METM6